MPQFGEEFLTELRNRCDIVSIVSRYVDLKKRSSSFVGLCPFHNEKTPSFHVHPAKQMFYCFGCHAGGDVITFIMKSENLTYPEAVHFLADSVGLHVPKTTAIDSEISSLRKKIFEMNRVAARYFHDTLMSDAGKPGLEYLQKRALTPQSIVRFGLGYAPESWDSLIKYMRSQGYTDNDLKSAGLVSVSEQSGKDTSSRTRIFDKFRNRVMFPIIDYRNNIIGFGGRTLADDPAKYLNSPENIVFRKGENLYAINYARTNKLGALILVEGYMDVIALHQAGFNSAVATLGTALTPAQARLMKRFTDKIIICYDSDAAGKNATRRAIEILKNVDLDVKVVTVTGGKDPDEFIKAYGADKFRALLDGSSNDIEYKLGEITFKYNLEIDSEKAACVREYLGVIAGIKNRVEREVYIDKIARETGLTKENLTAELDTLIRRKVAEEKKNEEKKVYTSLSGTGNGYLSRKNISVSRAEGDVISLILNFPQKLDEIEKLISPDDFLTDFNKRVYTVLCEKLRENPSSQPHLMLSSLFEPDEVGVLMGYITEVGAFSVDGEEVRAVADRLKAEKKKKEAAGAISDTGFQQYLEDLKKKGK
ncbi:MAG: DNA primase [Clostridia bacterium]|nr:DNA primase [Clostridia bacterium]